MMRKAALVLVLAVLLIGPGVFAQDVSQLVNPGFEPPYIRHGGASEVEVAHGWAPAWLEGDDRFCRAPCHRPEFKPEQQIAQDGTAQRWFSTFSRQFGTIYQNVSVEQGAWYELTCNVYAISEPNGQMGAFVGINPWGSGVFSRHMVWGREQVGDQGWIYREWVPVSVRAQAWSKNITVALAGNNAYATKNNAVYWDNCMIQKVDVGAQPTYTPLPTHTPYPTPLPCPTFAPNGGCDYDRIRSDVATVVADREPVRWP